PLRQQLRYERDAFTWRRINVEFVRETLYCPQPGTRTAGGGISVAQTFTDVSYAVALIQSQNFNSRDAAAIESARQQLPLRRMLDQISRGFSHHNGDSAELVRVKTDGPGQAAHFPPGFRHRARIPDVKVHLIDHQQPLTSIA